MHVTAPRFDWSFNFGHVLSSVTVMMAVGGAVWWQSYQMASFEHRIAASEARALLYIPRIDALMKSNDVQENRIENLADSVKGIRADIAENNRAMRLDLSDTNKNVATLRESMAEIKAILRPKP